MTPRALRVPCPTCGVQVDDPCRPIGKAPLASIHHLSRIEAAHVAAQARRADLARGSRGDLSMSGDTYAALAVEAKRRGRSLAGLVEQVVLAALDAEGAP